MEPMSEAATTEYKPLSRAAMERIISTTLPAAEAMALLKMGRIFVMRHLLTTHSQQHQWFQAWSQQQGRPSPSASSSTNVCVKQPSNQLDSNRSQPLQWCP